MVSVLIFTSIDFRNLSHTHKPLTHALLCQAFTAPSSLHCAGTTHTDAPRSRSRRDRNCVDRRRSRSRSRSRDRRFARLRSRRSASIAIIEISEIAIAISPISREASIAASRDRDRDLTECASVLLGFFTEKMICPGFYLSF